MYHMKLSGMYVTKIDYSYKKYATITLDVVSSTPPTVRVRSLEVSSGRTEAVILDDEDERGNAIIKALESLGYEKEKLEVRYSDISVRVGDTTDWGGSLEV